MLPHEIESASFQIIRTELAQINRPALALSDAELAVLIRVIHATADFEFADTLRFHPRALASGLAALRQGSTILTDVRMVQVGISARYVEPLGCTMLCDIAHPDVARAARSAGTTRSTMAMRRNAANMEGGIVVIGNAPTALLETIRLAQEDHVRPALVIGVPVGFVNAVESKDVLAQMDIPHITALGRKGGSTVAVAIVNALLRLASGT